MYFYLLFFFILPLGDFCGEGEFGKVKPFGVTPPPLSSLSNFLNPKKRFPKSGPIFLEVIYCYCFFF